MIVYDFDPVGIGLGPDKTDPPLLIHTNAVFSRSVALQRFEWIAGGERKVASVGAASNMSSLRAIALEMERH